MSIEDMVVLVKAQEGQDIGDIHDGLRQLGLSATFLPKEAVEQWVQHVAGRRATPDALGVLVKRADKAADKLADALDILGHCLLIGDRSWGVTGPEAKRVERRMRDALGVLNDVAKFDALTGQEVDDATN